MKTERLHEREEFMSNVSILSRVSVWFLAVLLLALSFAVLEETAAAQTCTQPPSGMVGWWPGDGNANDIEGSNNGTLENGAGFAAGEVAQAFSLDGINQYVDLGNDLSLQVSSGDFTVDTWVNFNSLGNSSGPCYGPGCDQSIVDKMASGFDPPNANGWRLLKQSDDHFWFCLGGGGSNACGGVHSVTTAVAGVWYHVAAVKTTDPYNGAAVMTIYVNGVAEASREQGSFADSNAADLRIGSYAQEGAFLNGEADEVELFDRALAPSEIAAIYNAGPAGKCKVINVGIEIKPPASPPVPIDQSSSGVIPVAILSSPTFDATQVDPATVSLAGAEVQMIGKSDKYSCSAQDVNGDGLNDLVCQVSTAQFLIQSGQANAVLQAKTYSGQPIQGQEAITIVPK
jgi:Concanavalin A-like lectin/glucanases superfamily